MPKLYEIKKGSVIVDKYEDGEEALITFDHLDGMYSYCTCDRGVVHLSANTPLVVAGDGRYHIQTAIVL